MIEAVLFDLDGTLLDTAPDFEVVLNALLREHGLPEVSYTAVRANVSNGARALIQLGFGITPDDPGFDDRLQALLERYHAHLAVHTVLFPGMQEVLEELATQRLPWGVVTNKPRRFTLAILESLGLNGTVGAVVCPDDVKHRKPDPEGLLLACTTLRKTPGNCLYVGDHGRDIEAGRRAGMTTVAALYGYIDAGDDPATWQADYSIDRAIDLLPLLRAAS